MLSITSHIPKMVTTKLFLRPTPLSSTLYSSSPPHFFFTKPKFTTALFLFSAASTTNNHSLPYGPSLLKGKQLQQQDQTIPIFDESQFTRIFHVAALRVPAKVCYTLESRLRGHLLNWPRVRNIARVPGDDMETQFITLFHDDDSDDGDGSLEVGDYLDLVLYRDKLAKSFNARGFVEFRNLARISRPRKRKRNERKEEEGKGKGRKEELCVVEVVEEERREMSGLLGEEFRGGEKWKGPTRLLLLDEELVDKDVKEFPEAIKVFCEFISIVNSVSVTSVFCIMSLYC